MPTALPPEVAALAAAGDAAHRRIARHVTPTPVLQIPLPMSGGVPLLVKAEHRQRTGSFKIRGALALLTSLTPDELAAGVVTASSGNHGLGVAQALADLGARGVVHVPQAAAPVKLAAIESLGVQVRRVPGDGLAAETQARADAVHTGRVYVSPYNDLRVVAGQATLGLELVSQVPEPDVLVVAVGGGGLVSGVAAAARRVWPDVRVIGASPAADAAMAASVAAGRVVDVQASATLSDGTAGGVEPDAVTLPLCAALVDEWVLVGEDDIAEAMRQVAVAGEVVEGAAATAIAAAAVVARSGRRVAVVSCGGNVDGAVLRRLGITRSG